MQIESTLVYSENSLRYSAKENTLITEYNPRKLALDPKSILSKRETTVESNLITTSSPSQYNGKNLGNIILVYSVEAAKADVYNELQWSLMILVGLAGGGLFVIYRVTNRVNGKIRTLLEQMNRFAGGELEVQMTADREDEIGQLCQGFNSAVANVGGIVREVAEASSAVASASSEISSSTEQMAAGAQEQTSQAGEVAGAVAMNGSLQPDVVLMDIEMPEMNGIEALRQMSGSRPVPVILFSMHDDPRYRKEMSSLGVVGYLMKPAGSRVLSRAIMVEMARFKDFLELKSSVRSCSAHNEW